jgi:PAS domain S-box-containing protein
MIITNLKEIGVIEVSKKKEFKNNTTQDLIELENYITDVWKFLPLPMAYLTPLGVIIDIDNAFERFLGYKKEEIIGKTINYLSYNEDELMEIQKKTQKKGNIIDNECIIKNKEGKEIPVSISTLSRKDSRGKIIGYFASFVDLSERKSSEEELRKREAFNLALFEYNPVETIVVDLEGRIVAFNQAVRKSRHRVPKIGDVMYRDYASKHKINMNKELMNCIKSGKTKEFPELSYNDKIFSITISPFPKGAVVISREITEQKRAEEKLRESEEKYRDLVENIDEVIYSIGDKGIVTYISPSIEHFIEYSPDEVIGHHFREFIHKKDIRRLKEGFIDVMSGDTISNEYRILTKSGEIKWMRTSSKPVVKGDKIIGVHGMLTDVTERKKAEEELKKSESKSRAILDAIPDLIFILNKNGVFLDYKAQREEDLYLPSDKFLGKKIDEVLPNDLVKLVKYHIKRALETGTVQVFEYQLKIKGEMRDYEARMVVSGEDEVLSIMREITESKKMEEELVKVEKLESLGVLAGGIAHDFNNILTGILGNITLAKMDTKVNEEIFKVLTDAEKATKQAKDLTQQLLTFSRGGAPVKKSIYIGDLIESSVNFALSGSNCSCEFSISKDISPVEVDEGQMNQVIQNLIINSDQAMPEGGVIDVTARNVTIGDEESLPLKEGKYVLISIEDNGVGIPKEHIQKMFDPYFTTKQRGSGLGLATAYSIIKRHGGHITVQSELGTGTTFNIYLPTSKKRIKKREGIKGKLIKGKGRILLMDDEEIIRETTGRMLKRLGYDVEFAEDGKKAIDLYIKANKTNEAFDIVIMDLTVPGGMGGKEAIRRLLEIDPGITAIVTSGYSTDPIMAKYSDYGFKGVVVKPYDIEGLSNALQSIVDN